MIKIRPTGYLGTNTYIIYNKDNECVVVDPGQQFINEYNQIKLLYKIKGVLLTHGHIDHMEGIKYFKDVPIYIHSLDYEFLFNGNLSLAPMLQSNFKLPEDCNIITINDGDKISLIGYNFKVIHTPGHTRGSVCYLFEEGLLSGDTMFAGTCGRTDFPTGNMADMRNSLQYLIDTIDDNTIVYPGHNGTTTIAQEKETFYY